MKVWRALLAVLVGVGVMTACGSDDSDGADATDPPASPASAASADFPRTIETALGAVEIPRKPERIVALGFEADAAVALGAVPVMVSGTVLDPTSPDRWLADAMEGHDVEVIDVSSGSVSFEKVAAARPDVILAGTMYGIEEAYAQLSQIAPTVTYEKGYYQDSWQAQVRLVGRTLGLDAEAEATIDDVEQAIAAKAEAHPEWQGKTFTFAFHYDASNFQVVNTTDDPSALLFLDLGLELAPGALGLPGQPGGVGAQVGMESTSALDADVLLMLYPNDELRSALEANDLFAGLPAVKDGRYEVISFELAIALRSPAPLSIRFALDEIEQHLQGALGS